tara:strand:+ start:2138 stop:5395 length:3258 start_codon:yes stop_codon:yes gene_type:complete
MANLSKTQLQSNINSEINDNTTGQITPDDIRHNLIDITDSINNLIDSSIDVTVANLISDNFSTPFHHTVAIGVQALAKRDNASYTTSENVAVGYKAMYANYQGSGNVAVGSEALSCNVFGTENSAIGKTALGGNVNGYGNVGIGANTLAGNKNGDFNIAIGQGAGYYADKDASYKLYISSFPVNAEYICANPEGSGRIPLVYGEMHPDNLALGVGTNFLHDNSVGILQASGNVIPTVDNVADLGRSHLRWSNVHLYDTLHFRDASIINKNGAFISSGSIVPFNQHVYDLGSTGSGWNNVYLNNLFASGNALIQDSTVIDGDVTISGNITSSGDMTLGSGLRIHSDLNVDNDLSVSGITRLNSAVVTQQAHYLTKTIHLASSGEFNTLDGGTPEGIEFNVGLDFEDNHPQGYLDDSVLNNAGFILRASGANDHNFRQYEFVFQPSGSLDSSVRHCLERDTKFTRSTWNSNISVHLDEGCHLRTERVIGTTNTALITTPQCYGLFLSSGNAYLGPQNIVGHSSTYGSGNVNFYVNSGTFDDYTFNLLAPESGVDIAQRFFTGTKSTGNQGFEIKAVNDKVADSDGIYTDRLLFSSYDKTTDAVNNLIFMKKPNASNNKGVFGINNFDTGGAGTSLIPDTIFNVRSKTNAEARITAENTGSVISALQLLVKNNCLEKGLEVKYSASDNAGQISVYESSGEFRSVTISNSGYVGVLNSGSLHDYLTVGGSGDPSGVIALHECDSDPLPTSGFGKIFVKEKTAYPQSQSLFFMDDSGNVYDQALSRFIHTDGLTYIDVSGNTFAGLASIANRSSVGGFYNTAYGFASLSGLDEGSYNTAIGARTATGLSGGSGNIVIGYNVPLAADVKNTISIGNNLSTVTQDNSFQIGNDGDIICSGLIGSYFMAAKGHDMIVESSDAVKSLKFSPNRIEVGDTENIRPARSLSFRFTGSGISRDLMTLDHSAVEMSGVDVAPSFTTPVPARPFIGISGDARILGALRFRDGSSLETAKNITFSIEGFMDEDVVSASSYDSPTSGILVTKPDGDRVFISNRDQYLHITSGDFIIANYVNSEYRPVWISNEDLACNTCCK